MPESPSGSVSFEVFYAATAQRTFDSVRRATAGDKHLANDAMQDAYLVMLQRWPQRRDRTMTENRRYVTGIAMNKVADAYRARGRFGDFEDADPVDGNGHADIDHLVDQLSVLQAVRDLIAAQPPRRRLVGVLFFLEDRGYDETAVMLDMTTSTVRTHVERLRQPLRRLVDRLAELERGGERS